MTGFGEATAENERYRVSLTVRSVNHRFLDLVIRLPEEHRSLENILGEIVRGELVRGRVEIRVVIESLGQRPVEVEVREDLLRQLLEKLEGLKRDGLLAGPITVADLVRVPQVLTVRETPPDWTEADEELVATALNQALEQVAESRLHEGESLGRVLLAKVDELGALASELERRRSEVADETRAQLEERLADLLGGGTIPEERLAQEAVLLVERGDVREELDRLAAHLEHFRSMASAAGPHGRRLEFVIQEIQRELNTLGSKCRDAEMSRAVVDGKAHCEQLREQILNVE